MFVSVNTLTKTLPALFFLFACNKSEDAGFVTLDTLCASYTEAVCDGRDNCCDEADRDVCDADVLAACKASQAELVGEKALSYSGEEAFRVLQDMRADLLTCTAPYGLGAFFEGGRKKDEPCARPAQCESLSCEKSGSRLVCSDASETSLCEPGNQ